MRHCSHCHGTAGDGNGPTAQYLNPRPRDYRHGVFKFTSTNDMSRASRNDLTRVLRYGIPGTYMPSFLLMEDDELEAIVEYVRFLAMRGEFERKLVVELSSDYSKDAMVSRIEGGETRDEIVEELAEFLELDMPESVDYVGNDLQEIWTAAETEEARVIPTVARVPDTAESRRRGRELYLSKTLNCADCHGIDGAGNGPQTMAFEKNPITNEKYSEPGLHDVWDNLNQPRNLQAGIFRGGRRPIDIFCRVYSGIKGSRMPSFKNTPHEDIWHIVNYVLSLPFESDPGATGSLASSEVAGGAEAGD
jgi:mono/diheme cytochrome c family protein